jgi:ubiquinone/menaquinone biosynthesis C-methylase UbiE
MDLTMTAPPADMSPTKKFYDRIAKGYDLLADSSEHVPRDRGLAMLAPQTGEQVLVVGFGTGHSAAALGKLVGPSGKVVGIDISQGMLDVAAKRVAAEAPGMPIHLQLGDARALPFADGQFDAAFMSFTLELFEEDDIGRVLAELRRVLRPGGRVAVISLNKTEPLTVAEDIYIYLHRHFPHFIDCQPIAVEQHLRAAGLKIAQAEHMDLWGLPVAIVIATT